MVIKGLNCLGIMGSSTFGGVELALIRTDGIDISERKKAYVVPYPDEMKEKIRSVLGLKRDVDDNEEKLHLVDIEVSDFYIQLIMLLVNLNQESIFMNIMMRNLINSHMKF